MFENLCTLPLSSDLFAQALHPTEPLLAVGLSGGHVQSFRLPAVSGSSSDEEDGDGNTSIVSSGTNTIDTEWRTRRHKGSCRTLAYSGDGNVLYSAGTDGLLKVASSSTGQVVTKFLIPRVNSAIDDPSIIHALSPQTLLLATDSAALHLCDLREYSTFTSSKPSQTYNPHDDYISSLTPLPPTEASTSGFSKQWVSTGGSTLAVTDLRRGVLVKSEDQEEELLSSVYVGGLPSRPGRSTGAKVLIGGASGVLTLWDRGVWDDQDERIIVDGGRGGGESLDSLALMPDGVGDGGKNVVVGVGDGTIRIIKLGPNKIVGEPLRHDEVESVVALGFDVGGRLISGGGQIIKVWEESAWLDDDDDDEEDLDADSDDSDEAGLGGKKRPTDSNNAPDAADSSDEDQQRPKKQKRGKKAKDKAAVTGILKFDSME